MIKCDTVATVWAHVSINSIVNSVGKYGGQNLVVMPTKVLPPARAVVPVTKCFFFGGGGGGGVAALQLLLYLAVKQAIGTRWGCLRYASRERQLLII